MDGDQAAVAQRPARRGELGQTAGQSLGQSLAHRLRRAVDALEQILAGLATGVLALLVLVAVLAVAALCLVGVGVLVVPTAARLVRAVADRERSRVSRSGRPLPPAGVSPAPPGRWCATRSSAASSGGSCCTGPSASSSG